MNQAPLTDSGSSARRRAIWPLIVLLLLGLAAALLLGNDFGMSWDEKVNAQVGADALKVFAGSRQYFSDAALADHGPVYFMLFAGAARQLTGLLPGWTEADFRHLVNFLTFLAGVAGFYALARRLVAAPFDWMATALFATQPLLFGYGFIAQKDIPFLSGFIGTLALGLAALDHWQPGRHAGETTTGGGEGRSRSLGAEWRSLRRPTKAGLVILALGLTLLTIDFLLTHRLHDAGRGLLEAAYRGAAPAPLQHLFNRVAVDVSKTPIQAYLDKYEALFNNAGVAGLILAALATAVAFSLAMPGVREAWGLRRGLADRPAWLASAVVLGLTVSMRQVGAFVGVLVSLAALLRGRGRAVFGLVVYWLLAAGATLVTWPYLWADPLGKMLESLRLASVFSRHSTLFRGQMYASGHLPWDFFPTLSMLQLTETTVALVGVGFFVIVWRTLRRQRQGLTVGLLLLWLGVPLFLLIAFHTAGYEFRHFLFLLPPLLLIAGIGLETIGRALPRAWARGLLFVVVVLPGLVGLVRLHPYEYIYFNSLAGGVDGADGLYQLDRECLSYREAIAFVNRRAPAGAVIVVPQQTNQVEPFARGDLVLRDISGGLDGADFILSCTWRDKNDFSTTGFDLIHEVRRGTAVLTQI
ncbi:MAG TPA: hypothetical protein VK449_06385, partial [Anaerolineales bacterium]|nr:hypothetical protein [Anaerolineales bacterium]